MGKAKNLSYKIILLQLGISQRELTNTLGLSEQYVSMLLAGKRKCKVFDDWFRPRLNRLAKMEDFIND